MSLLDIFLARRAARIDDSAVPEFIIFLGLFLAVVIVLAAIVLAVGNSITESAIVNYNDEEVVNKLNLSQKSTKGGFWQDNHILVLQNGSATRNVRVDKATYDSTGIGDLYSYSLTETRLKKFF